MSEKRFPSLQKTLGWNWYARRSNEIFCDLDSKRALFRSLQVIRRAMNKKMFADFGQIYLYPSRSIDHYHLVMCLGPGMGDSLTGIYAALWALWMGSDRLRAVYVLERIRRGVEHADIISTPYLWFREPDGRCYCKDKHKRKAITDNCPAMQELLLDQRSSDYFPRNFDKKEREPVEVPVGRLTKNFILGRQNGKSRREGVS